MILLFEQSRTRATSHGYSIEIAKCLVEVLGEAVKESFCLLIHHNGVTFIYKLLDLIDLTTFGALPLRN